MGYFLRMQVKQRELGFKIPYQLSPLLILFFAFSFIEAAQHRPTTLLLLPVAYTYINKH